MPSRKRSPMKAQRGGGAQRAEAVVGRSGCLASEAEGAAASPTGSTHTPHSIAPAARALQVLMTTRGPPCVVFVTA
jgi:L,D-peptidoglycan transpeptidase YkuD (ErfK/YbiS/YcfS/YnhG family)